MDKFLNFMQTQWGNIVILLTLLLTAFATIAKWTPTPKDDAWAARLLGWLNLLPHSAKKTLDESKK